MVSGFAIFVVKKNCRDSGLSKGHPSCHLGWVALGFQGRASEHKRGSKKRIRGAPPWFGSSSSEPNPK
jgi:hypothetical protein